MNYFISKLSKFNVMDKICFGVEETINAIRKVKSDCEDDIPDTEVFIKAETAFLKEENNKLKEKQYPNKVIKSDQGYLCPDCKGYLTYSLLDNCYSAFYGIPESTFSQQNSESPYIN